MKLSKLGPSRKFNICFLFFFFSLRLLKFQPLPNYSNYHQLAGVLRNVLEVLRNILISDPG